ncbi:MAG: PIN domain-containing protein [Kosmotogaceae bacterium]|nr:PIN domain-containing protein [Kosmotogaceae bacterium]
MKSQRLAKKDLERVVIDTSALIHLPSFSSFGEVFTVQGVIEEAKDGFTKMKLESLMSRIKIIEPESERIDQIRAIASDSGDIERLSYTDVSLLALALKLGCPIITDDYRVQNVALHAKIKFSSIFTPGIRRLKGKKSG